MRAAMHGKKQLLARSLKACGLQQLTSKLHDQLRPGVRVLAYHRILDVDESSYPFDSELISATKEDFNFQMAYLNQHYSVISFSELSWSLSKGLPPADNSVVVTFDDGFSDNYHHAFPILKEHSIPATFFVSTDYVGSERTFWFEEVAYCVKRQMNYAASVSIGQKSFSIPPLDKSGKERVLAEILLELKAASNQERLKFVDQIKSAVGVSTINDELSRPLNWSQIREIVAGGCEIGSHTITHPILAQQQTEQAKHEIEASKEVIERETKKACRVLSYPVGNKASYNSQVIEMVKAAGYDFACSYLPGFNASETLTENAYELKRIHVERDVDRDLFISKLALPEFI